MTMVSPKQLGVGDSDVISRRKSLRTRSSKRTAPEVTEVEEETKKKKQKKMNKKKKTKLSEPLITRIWNDEDVLSLLKGLVDYRAKTGLQSKIDWDEFYRFIGGSIVEKFSKDQVKSKMRKLKKKYYVQMEKIKKGNDRKLTRSSDYEVFGYSNMIWGENEAAMDKEMLNDNGEGTENATARQAEQSGSGEGMLKEQEEEAHDESLNDNEAVPESGTARRQAHQIESVEEMMKQQDEEADAGRLNENRAAKISETTDAKEGHDDNDEFCVVHDAFESLMSHGLSDYQRKMQVEKLLNIATDQRRELSERWKSLCVEERRLNLKKLQFSTKLAEALNDG